MINENNQVEEERRRRREDDKDYADMLEGYRAFKRLGKWALWLFSFLLVISTLIVTVRAIFKK